MSATRSLTGFADDVLFTYEGDHLISADLENWFGDHEGECTESNIDGHLRFFFPEPIGDYTYIHRIASAGEEPPPTLWVEWRFRSNHPIPTFSYTCDASFTVQYGDITEGFWMHGDAVLSGGADEFVLGLELEEFHTLRFESLNGYDYHISVDGEIFDTWFGHSPSAGYHHVHLYGRGGCGDDWIPNKYNEWDFVRYGTIGFGERIVAADPPIGFLDPINPVYANLDRFTVTYDSPNYAYIDDITVEVSCNDDACPEAPQVIATKRLDNGPSDVLQIVLDRPLPANERTTFTFHDADPNDPEIQFTQTVAYTFQLGDINADGQRNLRDFASLQNCFGDTATGSSCAAFNFHGDDFVDAFDFAAFLSQMLEP